MYKFVSEKVKQVQFSGIRKVFEAAQEMEKEGHRVIHLEIGRPDFDTPKHIKESAKDALDRGMVHYVSNYGILELREALTRKIRDFNKFEAKPNEILITVGASEAIFCSLVATLNPGDEILIPEPGWINYTYGPALVGAVSKPYIIEQSEGSGFSIDEIESKITEKTKMILINSPGNPGGLVVDREDVEALADLVIKHDLLILSDEVYEALVYDGKEHYSFASLPELKDRTVTVNSFSKTYSMTGWRIGYVHAPEHIIPGIVKAHQYNCGTACSFGQAGALTALTSSQDCVAEMVKEFDRRRKLVVEGFNSIDGIRCTRPEGAFYAFPDVSELGITGSEACMQILEKAKIALVPGVAFGESMVNYMRLSYASSYDELKEAMERLSDIAPSLKR